MSKKVFMLVANAVLEDPRVMRESKALVKKGYNVAVGGISLLKNKPIKTTKYGVKIFLWTPSIAHKRILKTATTYGKKSSRRKNSIVKQKINGFRLLLRTLNSATLFLMAATSLLKGFKTVKNFKPDIIHAHDLNALLPAIIMSKNFGAKVIYDSHEIFSEMGSLAAFYRNSLRGLEKKLIKSTNAIITVSDGIAKLLSQWYNVKPPYVLLNIPDENIQKPQFRQNNEIYFLYHGGISKGRGLEQLLGAFSFIPSNHKIKLIIRGNGLLKQTLVNMLDKYKLGKTVIFEEPVSMKNVVNAAASADIGVIPFPPINLNNILAMPNKLFEYMSAGLGIFCPKELVEVNKLLVKYKCGSTYKYGTPQEIAQQITKFLENENINEMKLNSFNATKKRFNWEKEVETLYKIYEQF